MNFFLVLTIASAAANHSGNRSKVGELRQKSFIKHHHHNSQLETDKQEKVHQMNNKMKNPRQKSFENHHFKKPTKRSQANGPDESFDRLTWMFKRYNSMQNELSIGKHSKSYNQYFQRYVYHLA